jgi:purine nucleosidase
MAHKIIYDTDPGIDDAMALLFAHLSPAIDLVGITTVFGNASLDTTTRNALYLKEKFSIPAPVYRGTGQPLLLELGDPPHFVHGDDGLGNINAPDPQIVAGNKSAAEYIVDTVMANPGEISLVAVGPVTNLALALRMNPDIAANLDRVVVMGGALGVNSFTGNVTPCAEANIASDPHAADIVFRAAMPVTMVGLDVTMKTVMNHEFMQRLKKNGGEVGEFIYKISRFYDQFHRETLGMDGFSVHDSSAIAYVINPDLFTIDTGALRVVTEGIAIGQTILSPAAKFFPPGAWDGVPHKQVCIDVESQKLLDLYERTICAT